MANNNIINFSIMILFIFFVTFIVNIELIISCKWIYTTKCDSQPIQKCPKTGLEGNKKRFVLKSGIKMSQKTISTAKEFLEDLSPLVNRTDSSHYCLWIMSIFA